jgi:hypothetical protein
MVAVEMIVINIVFEKSSIVEIDVIVLRTSPPSVTWEARPEIVTGTPDSIVDSTELGILASPVANALVDSSHSVMEGVRVEVVMNPRAEDRLVDSSHSVVRRPESELAKTPIVLDAIADSLSSVEIAFEVVSNPRAENALVDSSHSVVARSVVVESVVVSGNPGGVTMTGQKRVSS